MNGTLAVARYTLAELSRRRILLVFFIIGAIGIVGLGVGLKILYTVASSSGNIAPNNVDPAVFNRFLELSFVNYVFSALATFGLLIAFAIGMTAIYHDLDSGAAVSIFSKPVSRFAFATGKVAAAVAALVVIVGALALEARFVMFLFGGGFENALTGEALAVVGNSVVVMLIVLSLSTWMNNIVAAVVAFVYYNVITGVISFVHNLADNGVITNNLVKTIFDIAYWLVPHELVSSAIGDVAKASIAISGSQANNQALAGTPSASGVGDIVWWAFVVCFFAGLVYYAVRRRQV
jgi:ABC-type transport system involved in multi-copper enzyme maturation permease subunit